MKNHVIFVQKLNIAYVIAWNFWFVFQLQFMLQKIAQRCKSRWLLIYTQCYNVLLNSLLINLGVEIGNFSTETIQFAKIHNADILLNLTTHLTEN